MVPIVMHPGARENAEFRPYVNIGFRERPAKKNQKQAICLVTKPCVLRPL